MQWKIYFSSIFNTKIKTEKVLVIRFNEVSSFVSVSAFVSLRTDMTYLAPFITIVTFVRGYFGRLTMMQRLLHLIVTLRTFMLDFVRLLLTSRKTSLLKDDSSTPPPQPKKETQLMYVLLNSFTYPFSRSETGF